MIFELDREDILRPEVIEDLRQHANECYPNECVGAIMKSGYQRLDNTAGNPETHARVSRKDTQRLLASGEMLALAHSHPNGPNCPSAQDMASQIEMDVPFVLISTNGQGCLPPLIWGDQIAPPPLDESGFIHGIKDCYSRIRHFGMLHGFGGDPVLIDDFPRDWQWWEKNQNLYIENFRSAGFYEVPFADRAKGDVLMLKVRSDKFNHAGVLEQKDVLYHLSTGSEPYNPKRKPDRRPIHNFKHIEMMCVRYDYKKTS